MSHESEGHPGQPPLGRHRTCWSVHDMKIIITFENSAGEPNYDDFPLLGDSYDRAYVYCESKIKCYCVYQKPLEGNLDLYGNLTGGACDPTFPIQQTANKTPHPWSRSCRKVKKVCHPCKYGTIDVTPGNLPQKPCIPNIPEYNDTTEVYLFGKALQGNGVNNKPRGREAAFRNLKRLKDAIKACETSHASIMNCAGQTDDPTVPGCWSVPSSPPRIPDFGNPGHHGYGPI